MSHKVVNVIFKKEIKRDKETITPPWNASYYRRYVNMGRKKKVLLFKHAVLYALFLHTSSVKTFSTNG